jgi:1-acyl-sn-glycerol-3-phosphate acyltransferase
MRSYLRRHFHAVRLLHTGLHPLELTGPVVVVLNHPTWWDPLVCTLLSELFGPRAHFAVMESRALAQYRFFRRLGFFGVKPGTPQGAREFLRTAGAIVGCADSVLWITAQGRMADVRERPPGLQGGVARLARSMTAGAILPLALEYPFWNERLPEALAAFGDPISCGNAAGRSADEWLATIETALARAQDALAQASLSRDPQPFRTLVEGRAGVGGMYDFWRRCRAWTRGESFSPTHAAKRSGGEP